MPHTCSNLAPHQSVPSNQSLFISCSAKINAIGDVIRQLLSYIDLDGSIINQKAHSQDLSHDFYNSVISFSLFSSKYRQIAAASGRWTASLLQHFSNRSQRPETTPVQFSGRIAGGFPLSIAFIILKPGFDPVSGIFACGGFE